MKLFELDGTEYTVAVTKLKRSAKVMDNENAGRSKPGDMIRDIIGTYYNYTIEIATNYLSPSDYDALYQTLTAPVEDHQLTVAYGQGTLTFRAYVANVDDDLIRAGKDTNIWGNLVLNFVAMSPYRAP